MAEMIKDSILQKFNRADVSVFNEGESALNSQSSFPDIIILDYQLDSQNPKAINGIQVLMKLKQKFKAPVIFLSAQEKPEVAAGIMKYGAYDYVVKNQQAFQRLEILIKNIINNRKLESKTDYQKITIGVLAAMVVILAIAVVLLLVT